jgi:hypothetical protein
LFDIFYVADTVVACLLGLALFWTKKRKFVLSRVFSVPTIWMMKHLVGLELRVEGLENLPKDKKYIVASKHESALETIAFHYILPVPAYILKKELMYLPLFGWLSSQSMLSLSHLKLTIFWVNTPRVLPPFLTKSFILNALNTCRAQPLDLFFSCIFNYVLVITNHILESSLQFEYFMIQADVITGIFK